MGSGRQLRLVKTAVVLLLGFMAVGCVDEGTGSADDRKALAERLDSLGLWRDLSSSEREANVAAVARGVHPWATTIAPTVQFMVDGESLAEGGVEDFFAELRRPLESLGVSATVSTVKSADTGGYIIKIDDEVVVLYDSTSWNSAVESEQPWYASTMRPLAALNRRLADGGATERFFVLYPGGNDGIALLLDPEVIETVQRAGLATGKELPVEAK